MGREIYIVLSDSGTIPGRMIKRLTHFRYCHAMLALQADCGELYSFGRRSLYNFLNGGFVVEKRDGRFFSHFSETDCCVLELKISQEQYKVLLRELAVFCENAREFKYDFVGCCLRYFRMKKTFARRYTCSHFVAEVLQRAGICEFPNGTMLVRPEDLWMLPDVQVIYEGKLRELPNRYGEARNERDS